MSPIDPEREKVERADEQVRALEEPVIDDPTVFVKGAALGALTGIELAKLGEARARSSEVRAFAQRYRGSQQQLRTGLAKVAGAKRLDVPSALVHSDEEMLKGAPEADEAFDAWFVRQAHAEHVQALALFEAAGRMKDAELAAFARRTLPLLEADRKVASQLITR